MKRVTEKECRVVNERARVAVVGLGNLLLKDEGIGVHVVRALREAIGDHLPDVEVIDGGTSSMDALLLVGAVRKLIVVDAAAGGGPPGSVYRFRPGDILPEGTHATSVHQMNLRDSLQMLQVSGSMPEDVVIIGVEPGEIDWGMELTAELKEKLPLIIKVVMDELASTE